MIPWPDLPYELIGKAVVFLILLAIVVALFASVVLVLLFIWIRGWVFISNFMWRGYEPHKDRPPLWKIRVSGVTLAISRFQFHKIPAVYREADEIADDDLTAHQAMIRYLKGAFVDD